MCPNKCKHKSKHDANVYDELYTLSSRGFRQQTSKLQRTIVQWNTKVLSSEVRTPVYRIMWSSSYTVSAAKHTKIMSREEMDERAHFKKVIEVSCFPEAYLPGPGANSFGSLEACKSLANSIFIVPGLCKL